ncbi:MAG: hypothetical protein LBV49_04250 [Azonexus sp.]|jgi:hypothetical protein|nr:hypothetical protein [Azonexus sp.]
MQTISYIACGQTGHLVGIETLDLAQASLDALGDTFNTTFEFRRDANGFMEICEGEKPCFWHASSLKSDDHEAKMQCFYGALRDCENSRKLVSDVLVLVRDETGALIDVNPNMDMEPEDRAAQLTYYRGFGL